MKQHQGIWLPDHEQHLIEWMTKGGEMVNGRGTYQIKKLRAALEYCTRYTNAIDIGAHVGMWSMRLGEAFETVTAFEPVADHRECFTANVGAQKNVLLYPYALGADRGLVKIETEGGSSGNSCARPCEDGDVMMRALDSFDFHNVDFIKIDCEGFEEQVVLGARETFQRCHPCVIVEQKAKPLADNYGKTGTPAVDLLIGMGARVRRVISGDYIMTW